MSKEVQHMFDGIAHRYDLANDVLSFGMHRLWRQKLAKVARISPEQNILDLCAGTGDVAFELAKRLGPKGRVYGLDFVYAMLHIARIKREKRPSGSRVYFLQGDAMVLPFPDRTFNLVTISFGIRNVDDPSVCLKEIRRVLVPGGRIVVLEFGRPQLPVFSTLYALYSRRIMPSIGGLLTGDRSAYEYLPRTAREFPAADAFVRLMTEAGFTSCHQEPLLSGVAYLYDGQSPP